MSFHEVNSKLTVEVLVRACLTAVGASTSFTCSAVVYALTIDIQKKAYSILNINIKLSINLLII